MADVFIFKICFEYINIVLRFRAKFTDEIMWTPVCWWHYFGTVYICGFFVQTPFMLKFYHMCSLGFIFIGLSTALSDKDKLIYYLIRFDKILTM